MTDKHLSTQFDAELSAISTRVLEMGGLVESQVAQAIYALTQFSAETATQVLEREARWKWTSTATCRRSSPAASPPRATCAC
jgi:phosphate uptake regulator